MELTCFAQWNHTEPAPSGRWTLWYHDFPASANRFFVRQRTRAAAPADRKPFRLNNDPDSTTAAADRRLIRSARPTPATAATTATTAGRRTIWNTSTATAAAADRRGPVWEHSGATNTDRGTLRHTDSDTASAIGRVIWRFSCTGAAPGNGRALRILNRKHRRHVWETGRDNGGRHV